MKLAKFSSQTRLGNLNVHLYQPRRKTNETAKIFSVDDTDDILLRLKPGQNWLSKTNLLRTLTFMALKASVNN